MKPIEVVDTETREGVEAMISYYDRALELHAALSADPAGSMGHAFHAQLESKRAAWAERLKGMN